MNDQSTLESLMRFAAPAFALSLALGTVSSVGLTRLPDSQINPLSAALVTQAKADLAASRFDAAIDTLETALAVDPRNRQAFLTLAQVARKQALPGKAIRFYREALLLEPNDVAALSGQGEALVQKGALAKARDNLARIQKLCATSCPEQIALAAAIQQGAAAPVVAAQAVKPTPSVTQLPAPKPN
jgi:cytochrome c-type biogenesis protein CcmH/NrfG